jgi:hypothetical protein
MRILAAAVSLLGATAAIAQPDLTSEIRRAAEAVSLSTSEEPALRQERAVREPSPGFLLGAAYRAWTNATVQLDFDLSNPTAAGPAHASQNGELSDFIKAECREEAVAFENLERRSKALGVDASRVVAAAGAPPADAAAWIKRRGGAAAACP